MSIEAAKLLIERVKTDRDFARKLMKCKNGEARMAFVQEAGFDFTFTEIYKVSLELSEEEVDLLLAMQQL